MSKSRPTTLPNAGVSFVEAMDFVANNGRPVEVAPAPTVAIIEAPAPSMPIAAAPSAVIEPAPVVTQVTDTPARLTTTSIADSQPMMGKKEASPAESFDYAATFLRPVRTRKTRAIYVDEALHQALTVLTQVACVGLADLLINIANDHFATYRPAIQKYMNDQEKLRKKHLPY